MIGLAFAYPDGSQVLYGVDLTVQPGERVALLGPNGAGKTTLVLHLNGIHTAGAGEVRVGGLPVTKENFKEIRRRVGIVFQDPDDQLFMPTVFDDVAFGPANLGLRGDELAVRVEQALGAVGMEAFADRPPYHLSYGQRRRVAVATVLAMEPQILVLDEPSSNLDPAARRELADILLGLELTTLMVTHDLPYALELCPACRRHERRGHRGRRGDARRAGRRGAHGRQPAGAAVRVRPDRDPAPLTETRRAQTGSAGQRLGMAVHARRGAGGRWRRAGRTRSRQSTAGTP